MKDWDEFTTKTGNVMRIMDLRDYYESLGSTQKTETNSDEYPYACECPYCKDAYLHDKEYHGPYLKHKLYITKDFSFGWCHRCDSGYITNEFNPHYYLPDLTKKYGAPSLSDLDFTMRDPHYTLDFFKGLPEGVQSDRMMDFLYDRNPYLMDILDDLKVREEDEEHLLIPFYWNGELIYYQVWQTVNKPKYKNPSIRNKPLYIFGEKKSKAILVEGVFTAIACKWLYPDRTPIAVIGSTVTLAQDLMLRSMFFDEILIKMDTATLSYKVYNKLKVSLEFTDLKVEEAVEDTEDQLRRLIKWERKLT